MCGIVGRFHFDGSTVNEQEIRKMAGRIVHRGPDDSGFFVQGNIGLGMRRLSIIDVAKGHQPVFNEDKSIVVVYNGEIYNYRELTEKLLRRGHKFRTHSDTETLVHLYEEEGPEFVKRLNGMFAFALWDERNKKLLLGRDRVGIKPLSYFLDSQKIIFGSEIKSILCAPDVALRPNEDAIRTYFIKAKYLACETFFRGINHLPAGHVMEIDGNGTRFFQYWDVVFNYANGTPETELLRKTGKIIDASVKSQLISEVPLGSYLSGGIDSSSVAVAASKATEHKLDTFGAVFPEFSHHDEATFQQDVAQQAGISHHQHRMTSECLLDDFRKIMWHIDQPLAGITIGQFRMARFAHEKVKVILTGHGGDELFGGYPNHLIGTVLDSACRNGDRRGTWKNAWKQMREVARDKQLGWSKIIYNVVLFAPGYVSARRVILWAYELLLAGRIFTFSFLMKTRAEFTHERILELLRKSNASGWLDRMLYVDIKLWLPNLLMVEDKESMAHSLEDRVPLLDNTVIDLALRVPGEMKIKENMLKSFLRASQADRLPDSVLKHEKKGFPQPWAEWIREPEIESEIRSLLSNGELVTRTIVKKEYIEKTLGDHMRRGKDRSWEVWQLLSTEVWFHLFFPSLPERQS